MISSRRVSFWGISGLVFVCAGWAAYVYIEPFSVRAAIVLLMQWIEAQGAQAVFWIVGLQALMTVLVIPGPFFTIAAGFLFGAFGGLLVSVTGSVLGAVIAYILARLPRISFLEKFLRRHSRLRMFEHVMRDEGWKAICATRLIPGFPFKLSNYFFGLLRFPFVSFLLGTVIGIIPVTWVSVSVGSLASDISSAIDMTERPGGSWVWSLASLLAALCFVAYTGWRMRRRLHQEERRN